MLRGLLACLLPCLLPCLLLPIASRIAWIDGPLSHSLIKLPRKQLKLLWKHEREQWRTPHYYTHLSDEETIGYESHAMHWAGERKQAERGAYVDP